MLILTITRTEALSKGTATMPELSWFFLENVGLRLLGPIWRRLMGNGRLIVEMSERGESWYTECSDKIVVLWQFRTEFLGQGSIELTDCNCQEHTPPQKLPDEWNRVYERLQRAYHHGTLRIQGLHFGDPAHVFFAGTYYCIPAGDSRDWWTVFTLPVQSVSFDRKRRAKLKLEFTATRGIKGKLCAYIKPLQSIMPISVD